MKNFIITFFVFCNALLMQAQAPVANFIAITPTSGCGFLSVSFQDQSTGNPTSWDWDFGDGTTHSTLQNPTHVYSTNGTYTVKLKVTNAYGNNTFTRTNYIVVHKKPVANFSGVPLSGCQPLTVQFSDVTTVGDGPVSNWNWNFGDGYSSTAGNPSHTYTNPGTYNIILLVTDIYGCSANKTVNSYITVYPNPVAGFTSSNNTSCSSPATVDFTSTSTGSGLTYFWDFGDGNTSTVQNPSHQYTTGQYSVTLIVTNSNGCSDTLVMNNFVNIVVPVPNIAFAPNSGCKPFPVSFQCLNTGIASALWNFGDGGTSTALNPSHTYTNSGIYTITFSAVDTYGCPMDTQFTDTIEVYPTPVFNFSALDPVGCMVPFTVDFTADPGYVNYVWSFGGPDSANASNTYNAFGNYSVTLTVTDTNGCVGTLTKPNYVQIAPPPITFSADVLSGCVPLDVQFTSASGGAGTTYIWDFGDGSPVDTAVNPLHTYGDSGVFNVTLSIINAEGCTNTITMNNYIMAGLHPQVGFFAEDTIVCYSEMVAFHDSSSSFAESWYWAFGDGQFGNGPDPTHQYGDTGTFTVSLVATHNGCRDTLIKDDYIVIWPPIAAFSPSPALLCSYPDTVHFTDQSVGAETWLWTFADGGTDTVQNPDYVYNAPGSYMVELLVTNSNGCRDSIEVQVRVDEVFANFQSNIPEVCMYDPVVYSDLSTSYVTISNRAWTFGDGATSSGAPVSVSHSYNTAGVYDVTLLATDSWGCTDDTTITSIITVNQLPSPNFTPTTPLTGCTPLTVEFTDNSTAAAPAILTNWLWNFGNGSTSTVHPTVQYTYYTAGNYNISLTVTDSKGCDSTRIFYNYVQPTKPNPSFHTTHTNNVYCYSETVTFVNTSTAATSYEWDFGDGSPVSTLTNPTHTYVVDTTTVFTVTLVATDANGCDSAFSLNITVSMPFPDFTAPVVSTLCPPLVVDFSSLSSSDVTQYLWNFGDSVSGTSNTSTTANPQHVYYEPGDYDITLSVTNNFGCVVDTVFPLYVHVGGPTGEFTYAPLSGCAPLEVTFTTTNLNADSVRMVYGDGFSDFDTGSATYTHIYQTGNDYVPTMILYNYDDTTGVMTCQIMKQDTTNPIHVISGIPGFVASTPVCPNMPLQFIDQSVVFGTITSWDWDLGNGSVSTLQNPTTTYDTPGFYDVSLSITVEGICNYDTVVQDYVEVLSTPDVPIYFSHTAACGPVTTDFSVETDSLIYPAPVFFWDFNNGATSTDSLTTSSVFSNTGIYNVVLTVTYSNGCTMTDSVPVQIYANTIPEVSCNPQPNPVLAEVDAIMNNTTNTFGIPVEQLIWSWDLGDGTITDEYQPTHSYGVEGLYDIVLMAFTDSMCSDTAHCPLVVGELLNIPNVFTPNGDGFNDYFEIVYYGGLTMFDLSIFNRWGIEVFHSTDKDFQWDGTINGAEAASGTYFYIVKITTESGKSFEQNGTCTLIRED